MYVPRILFNDELSEDIAPLFFIDFHIISEKTCFLLM